MSELSVSPDLSHDSPPTAGMDLVAEAPRKRDIWGFITMPLVLIAVLVILFVSISTQSLDSIEARSINWPTISSAVLQHIGLTAVSTAFVLIIAVPLGIMLTRDWTRSFRGALITIANIGQAIPTIGLIALMAVAFTFIGFNAAIIALVAYAILPVLRNTMVGLEQVDESVLEAGRGMGMSKGAVLRRLQLPLAVPVILAGVRTALVINVGSATLAAYINSGGLGTIIVAGLSTNRILVTITGAALTAVLALFIDYLAGLAETFLRPKGL